MSARRRPPRRQPPRQYTRPAPSRWPAEVAHLPVCPVRKLPVPFITPVEDGRAAWAVLDPQRQVQCLKGRLCAMCGLPMGTEIAFLCDPAALNSYSVEPPVHERCAELAAAGLCPFVSLEQVPRRPGDPRDVYACPPEAMTGLAKRPFIIAVCNTYEPVLAAGYGAEDRMLVFVPGPAVRIRRFAYVSGRLAEVTR
jgi:hypothetical protein